MVQQVRARRAFIDGSWQAAAVTFDGGRITAIDPYDTPSTAGVETMTVADEHVLIPGLVDSHVHIDEPGRTEWEGFASATRAAAKAGVTLVADMPLNSVPVTTSPDALEAKLDAAKGQLAIDVAYWGGAVPESLGKLGPLHDAGVVGFKCFLAPSGIDEFGHLDAAQLLDAQAEIAELGSVLIAHAEDPAGLTEPDGTDYGAFLASRPPSSERTAIEAVIAASAATGCRAHIVHLSDAGSLPILRDAQASGVPITVETCPHYLTIDASAIPVHGTEFKCCPPIRSRTNQDALWEAVVDGTIALIVSDHSPATVELKRAHGGDFSRAWGGIAGLQTAFASTWAEAERRGVPLETLLQRCTTGPAALIGMPERGRIAVGSPADLVVFDPTASWTVDSHQLEHRNPISAFHGRTALGAVQRTWLRGETAYDAGTGFAPSTRGRSVLAHHATTGTATTGTATTGTATTGTATTGTEGGTR